MAVKITFNYEPVQPDPDDSTGMEESEFISVTDHLMQIGADDIEIDAG